MKPANETDHLNQILGADEDLTPSSGFVASVMERVREEATAPKPIPFPWKRALPGMVVGASGFAWCAVNLVHAGTAEAGTPILVHLHSAASISTGLEDAGWVAAAFGVSLLSWLLARRIMGGSELM